MIRASFTRYEEVDFELPYGSRLDTSTGDHRLVMPVASALSLCYALRDVLKEQGIELEN